MIKKTPIISVILINYNNGNYIVDAIKSIAAQTFADWECIIVDDGSTDDSRKIIKTLTAKDKRFRLVFQKNQGACVARNVGLRAVRGDYVMFLDSDDCYTPIAMKAMLKIAKEHDADLVGGRTITTHNNFKPDFKQRSYDAIMRDLQPFFTTSNNPAVEYFEFQSRGLSDDFRLIWIWRQLFRRDLLAGKFFPEDLFPGEDILFMLDVIGNVKKAALVNCPVTYHRISATSSMNHGPTASNTLYFIETIRRVRKIMDHYPEKIREPIIRSMTGFMFKDMVIRTMRFRQFREIAAAEMRKTYGTPDFPKNYLKWRPRVMVWLFLKAFPESRS